MPACRTKRRRLRHCRCFFPAVCGSIPGGEDCGLCKQSASSAHSAARIGFGDAASPWRSTTDPARPGGAASRLKQIPMYSGICRKQSREAYSVRGIAPGKRTFLFRSRLPAYSRAPRLRLPGSRSGASRIPSLPVQMCSNAASSNHTVPRRTGRAVLSHQERKSPKGTGQV